MNFLLPLEGELPFISDTQFTTCWRLRRVPNCLNEDEILKIVDGVFRLS